MSESRKPIYDMLDKNTHSLSLLCDIEYAVKQSEGGEQIFRERILPIQMRILKQQRDLLRVAEALPV